jgi:hypothetical protein
MCSIPCESEVTIYVYREDTKASERLILIPFITGNSISKGSEMRSLGFDMFLGRLEDVFGVRDVLGM